MSASSANELSAGRPVWLILALGNDILGDDGVAWCAAQSLEQHCANDPRLAGRVAIVRSAEAGLAIMELLEGYDRALLLDAVVTGRGPVGTIHEFGPDDFRRVIAPSPHYAGLPEVLALGERLGIKIARDLRVLALEVEDPYTLCEGLSSDVERALPAFIERAAAVLEEFLNESS